MTEQKPFTESDSATEPEDDIFPVEPRYHPIHKIPRKIYDFLASAKLAMVLLVVILACCVSGVTVVRDKRAWDTIFSTLWFNGLLVLLIVNVACCFFGRIWGRRITLISLGMILFHLCFVTMFAGIIYNSLFYFRGSIRLTEGETLPNGDPQSYDTINMGRFFSFAKLKGDTTLIKLHTGYKVDGDNKRAAYEVSVGSGPMRNTGIIYLTKHLEYRGFSYYPEKEGYSALAVLSDNQGREMYGGFLALQSLKVKEDGSYIYTVGTKDGASVINFPPDPNTPLVAFNVAYRPDKKTERTGDIYFDIYPISQKDVKMPEKPLVAGKVGVGESFDAGSVKLAVKEIRYWTAMTVRYEPGKPIVLTSLWVGLFGITLTTLARMSKKQKPKAVRAE
ncbi:MAG TPA: hypothetical protein HPP97_04635 [Desulfuromonadales bacterium]|nr:hypothetical protein [Desulfuromonadales bacterium]